MEPLICKKYAINMFCFMHLSFFDMLGGFSGVMGHPINTEVELNSTISPSEHFNVHIQYCIWYSKPTIPSDRDVLAALTAAFPM